MAPWFRVFTQKCYQWCNRLNELLVRINQELKELFTCWGVNGSPSRSNTPNNETRGRSRHLAAELKRVFCVDSVISEMKGNKLMRIILTEWKLEEFYVNFESELHYVTNLLCSVIFIECYCVALGLYFIVQIFNAVSSHCLDYFLKMLNTS